MKLYFAFVTSDSTLKRCGNKQKLWKNIMRKLIVCHLLFSFKNIFDNITGTGKSIKLIDTIFEQTILLV